MNIITWARNLKRYDNQHGQALLIVIVSLTVALAVISQVSLRNLSSLARVAETDTYTRVYGAAEGGLERFLGLSSAQLSGIISNPSANCSTAGTGITYDGSSTNPAGGPACVVSFPADSTAGDNVSATAYVKAAYQNGASFDIKLHKDNLYELNLNGPTPPPTYYVCWKTTSSSTPSAIYVLQYSNTTLSKAGYCYNSGGCGGFSGTSFSGFGTAASGNGSPCPSGYNQVQLTNSSYYGSRIRAIGSDMDVKFIAGSGTFPVQGFVITSYGVLTANATTVATKQLIAFKSLNYLPAIFDFGIYSGSTLPN